jgi:caffeoyl-CoA O-methyltransferase
MFHHIPTPILEQMQRLEQLDKQDRLDGSSRLHRLRQIPPETGKFISLLAASAPVGAFLEIGTSAGYSSLWLSLACRAGEKQITTFEVQPEKANLARETFRLAGIENLVKLVEGDARLHLKNYDRIAFCFLDADKDIYAECYESVIPHLVHGGFLVADNALSHADELRPVLGRALEDKRVDALVVPIGKGILVCHKL